jgi:hypothetical protein
LPEKLSTRSRGAFRGYLTYIDERGANPIAAWLTDPREVPIKAKAKIDRILLQLADTPIWVRPLTSNLDTHEGIVEIRIQHMNVLYRPLGFRGPGDGQFTLLCPAREQGDEFIPRNAPMTAENRMKVVLLDPRRTCEHRFS